MQENDSSKTMIEDTEPISKLGDTTAKLTARLVVLAGAQIGREYCLGQADTVIGRGQQADIEVHDDKSSRRHSMLNLTGEICKVHDLGSTNGTYVNETKVVTEVLLADGDTIRVGRTTFKYLINNPLESRYHDKLFKMATTDDLSGLYLRNFFMEELEREIGRAVRHGGKVTLLMIDIDHFKSVNDTYGHQAGDEAIRVLGRLLKLALRNEDVTGRYGGEEFIAYLPETLKDGAVVVAERFREAIEKTPVRYGGDEFSMTVSQGLASFPEDTESLRKPQAIIEKLIGKADQAMYKAKNSGRNMVCFWD